MRIQARIIGGLLVTALVSQLSACGTLFYPDRRGQIEGRIDPAVAILDAIGILFYVIPGLIAFGIDFASGAIYLPNKKVAQVDPQALQKLVDEQGQVDRVQLQNLIFEQTGENLPLTDPRLQQHSGNSTQLAANGWAIAA
ncbi:polyribonucleotide nucleotidyltransferase [Pseudomonas sp. 5P_3.1_Bac2]|uniref:polyribonucleotide nucleotidyltransferase n=1 Tax=Pseudomonas sp. 5P_3.1_Bac2 TaxID=2971617 RepID=UPI0021C68859|nr:polyribonucleotide nucleotidyltransferase [Pseudomonas sp. 5P_3.1_Bac2]MCU1718073.1 polyribonucleotide nucleotidyltransferase [Pseudomonas sp. 5P_3.1_Bac2]